MSSGIPSLHDCLAYRSDQNPTGMPDKLIAHVEVGADLAKGARHDPLEFCIDPARTYPRRKIQT